MNHDEIPRGPRVTTARLDACGLEEHWGWLIALGGLTMLGGVLALLVPALSALAIELVLGALLIAEGALETVHAFRVRRWRGMLWRLLGALVALVAGGLLLSHPTAGVLGITLIVGAFFVAAGIVKLVLAYQVHPVRGWGWLGFHGVLSTLLGGLILCGWPWAAPGVLGLLVGIDLLFSGWWLVMLGLMSRAAGRA